MTLDDIIRIAKEADIPIHLLSESGDLKWSDLERFAAIALAYYKTRLSRSFMDGYESGTKEEREACAALLDKNAMTYETPIYRSLLQANAEEIRARGQS